MAARLGSSFFAHSALPVFPLRDNIPSRTTPIVNYAMIGLCILVFVLQQSAEDGLVMQFGMIPVRVTHPDSSLMVSRERVVQTPVGREVVVVDEAIPQSRFHPYSTVLSCVFLHGSLMHLLGNVWFLFVFGDNVEDRLGKLGYLCFYLASGIAASLTHYFFDQESPIPTIGASGAVAGVMGAYMLQYPSAKVTAVFPILFILQMIVVPAPLFLGVWFVIQLVQGTFVMGGTAAAGVAWWAHAGGFAFGALVALILGKSAQKADYPGRIVVRKPPDWQ